MMVTNTEIAILKYFFAFFRGFLLKQIYLKHLCASSGRRLQFVALLVSHSAIFLSFFLHFNILITSSEMKE